MTRSIIRLGMLLLLGAGCASVQRVPLKSGRVVLPDGRFVGPVEIPVPRRVDHDGHDFEIRVTLRSRCAPKLTLAFPDGETRMLGEDDRGWQDLLARRAKSLPAVVVPAAATAAPTAAATATATATGIALAPPAAPAPVRAAVGSSDAIAAVDAQVVIAAPARPTGHWAPTLTDSWPGQLAFERARTELCAASAEYRLRYLNAFDESGTLALWAEVPQELFEAELEYEIVELVPPKKAPPLPVAVVAIEPPPVLAPPATIPSRPRPPVPAPKTERPEPAIERAATWQPGRWVWSEGEGEWVWHDGHWRAPAQLPGPQVEATGAAPNPECAWVSGYWTWEQRDGKWVWQGGHWNPPPARAEVRGEAPGEGSQWSPGYWTWRQVRFVWISGHWGKPAPRAEPLPARPSAGARWIPGDWIFVKGTWVWSAGFYQGDQRPPAPRVETPPPAPAPGAIWLQGYWRWESGRQAHEWIAGHWELPPGEGYVWVPDPVGPGGLVLRGHWELRLRRAP